VEYYLLTKKNAKSVCPNVFDFQKNCETSDYKVKVKVEARAHLFNGLFRSLKS